MSKSSVVWLWCGAGVGVLAIACALQMVIWPSAPPPPVVLFWSAVFIAGVGIGVGAGRGQVRGKIRAAVAAVTQQNDAAFALRVVEGTRQAEMLECDTRELCAHAANAVALHAARKAVVLELDVGTRCQVLCDQPRLEQALTNLLGHAINQTPADGVVSLYVDESEQGLEFAVHDTGPGIPAEDLDAIFLWNAGAILDAHGTTLAVENHIGGGTTFRFALPKIAPSERSAPEASGEFTTSRAARAS